MMKNPERRKDERVVKCARARPDIGETKRSDDTGILRQMRFVVPNETGSANTCVGEENQEQEQNRTNQTHPPLDKTRFTEGHRLTDGVEVTLLSTPCSVSRVDDKIQANAAESITPAYVSLGAMDFSLLSINWQVIR